MIYLQEEECREKRQADNDRQMNDRMSFLESSIQDTEDQMSHELAERRVYVAMRQRLLLAKRSLEKNVNELRTVHKNYMVR